MARGSIIAPFLGGTKLCTNSTDPLSQTATADSPRMSSSSIFPALSKLDTTSSELAPSPSRILGSLKGRPSTSSGSVTSSSGGSDAALLSLKFSGPSFLDVVIKDSRTKDPLYIIETIRDATCIYRLDAEARKAEKVSTVQWPANLTKGKGKTGRTVQMGEGRWRETEEFLKYGALGNYANRKFNIPHFPHPLKWKLVPGNSYYCSTSGIKGPIAVLDAAVLSAPPRLRVFHTPLNGDAERTQANYNGVPVMLLDYLITTALLMVTEVQEWLDRPQLQNGRVRIPGSQYPVVQKWLAIIHDEPIPGSPTISPAKSDWDTQSGMSGGSASASAVASMSSDPLTPLTPATSVQLNISREDDIPPVPPLPQTMRARPQTLSVSHPYATAASSDLSPSPSPSSSPLVPSATLSTKKPLPDRPRRPRPLPKPPVTPGSAVSYGHQRPWTSDGPVPSSADASVPASSALITYSRSSSMCVERSPSPASTSSSASMSRRARLGRSLSVVNAPPQPPPPSHAPPPLPLKLAHELSGSHYEPSSNSAAAAMEPRRYSNPLPQPPIPHPPQDNTTPQMSVQTQIYQIAQNLHTMTVQAPAEGTSADHNDQHPSYHTRPMVDAGMVHMPEADSSISRDSYAETVSMYEPPPAYDAIDWSLPQVHLPAHARMQ